MVKIGPLGEEPRRTLERLRRRAVGRVSQRAHMVLLSTRGYTVSQIATIFDVGEDTVRTWLHRYQQDGVDGLADCPRPGRPLTVGLARSVVDEQASVPPHTVGLVQNCWTVGLLAAFVGRKLEQTLSLSSVRRWLKESGWRWARPRLAPATHAPDGQRKVDPEADDKLARIQTVLASAAAVLYLDECELNLLPVLRAMWMKGPRTRIPTPGQNAKRVVFGALNARTGTLHTLLRERKRAVDFVAFLEQLATAYPTGAVVLVLDNVVTHDAKLVRHWRAQPAHERFQVLWLPKYSAHEHNPIERVWALLKDAVAANRLHGSIEDLATEAEAFLATRSFQAPHPGPSPVPAQSSTPTPLAA
jgi:transposase